MLGKFIFFVNFYLIDAGAFSVPWGLVV